MANQLYLRGNLVRKPILKTTATGTYYALARIAESVMKRNADGIYIQVGKEFHNVAAYGNEALILGGCDAGQQLELRGHLNTTNPRYRDQFIATSVNAGLRKGERYVA